MKNQQLNISFIQVTQAKHVQFVSGVNSMCYWGGTLCWDLINYTIPGIGFLILFAAFDLDGFRGELGTVFLLIVLFGFSMLPFVYLLSFVFTGPIAAYAFVSSLVMILRFVLTSLPESKLESESVPSQELSTRSRYAKMETMAQHRGSMDGSFHQPNFPHMAWVDPSALPAIVILPSLRARFECITSSLITLSSPSASPIHIVSHEDDS